MPFSLDPEIKKLLHSMLDWAAKSYREECAKAKNPYASIGFSLDEREIAEHYPKIRDYFLGAQVPQQNLRLNLIADDATHNPPWTQEQKLERAFEEFLQWAGLSISRSFQKDPVDSFLSEFEKGFDNEPREISYIPIFGLTVKAEMEKFTEIILCDGLSFTQLGTIEHDLLRIEAGTYKETLGVPGIQNILPSIALKIDLPVGKHDADSMKTIHAAIEYFRVMMVAFFGANVSTPLQFTGHKTPWHPFMYFTGRHPREFPEGHGHWSLGDHELRIFKKYWPVLYPKGLKRYHITANRLARSDDRIAWQDKVVDIAIAMESLIQGKTELIYRLSTVIPWLVCEKAEERPAAKKRINDFYTLRSTLVHGETIESDKDLRKKFEKLSPKEFEDELDAIKRDIRKSMMILLLNEDLQDSQGQNQLVLGCKNSFTRSPSP